MIRVEQIIAHLHINEEFEGLSQKDNREFSRILIDALKEELAEESETMWMATSVLATPPSHEVRDILRKIGIQYVEGKFGNYYHWRKFLTRYLYDAIR